MDIGTPLSREASSARVKGVGRTVKVLLTIRKKRICSEFQERWPKRGKKTDSVAEHLPANASRYPAKVSELQRPKNIDSANSDFMLWVAAYVATPIRYMTMIL